MPGARPSGPFPVDREYTRCIAALESTGILTHLPGSGRRGAIGADERVYPVPTLTQAADLFDKNKDLIESKVLQEFDHVELTPMAMPVLHLTEK